MFKTISIVVAVALLAVLAFAATRPDTFEVQRQTLIKAPPDMVRVVRTVFDLKQAGKLTEASALLSWLSGSTNVAQGLKKVAGIRGDITSTDAMGYLRGILEIVKSAGYAGLVIVIDEAEAILRMKSDVRQKSLNGIRQICDDAKSYPGLLWIFTGTQTFFDDRRGVKRTRSPERSHPV